MYSSSRFELLAGEKIVEHERQLFETLVYSYLYFFLPKINPFSLVVFAIAREAQPCNQW